MNKIFYFDVETTGLDPVKNDIIQLAYQIEIDGSVIESEDIRMQPVSYNNINPKALEVHGLSVNEIKQYQEPLVAYQKIIKVLDKYIDKFDKNDKFTPCRL